MFKNLRFNKSEKFLIVWFFKVEGKIKQNFKLQNLKMKLVKFPVSPLKFFLIFLLIGPTLCLSESFGCPGFESAEEIGRTPPILTLSKLPRLEMQEFRNNDVVINATKITPINLDCWAAYPIDLTFSGHLVCKW